MLLRDGISPLLIGSVAESEIINTIENFEPRVKLNEVIVKANAEDNQFDVQIQYYIVGIDVPPQELSFALEPTR